MSDTICVKFLKIVMALLLFTMGFPLTATVTYAESSSQNNQVANLQSDDANASLQAGDSYLTDKVVLGSAETGVYMSVKGTESNPYLNMEPINGSSGTVTVDFSDWDEYVVSDYYLKVISPYKDKIASVKIADGATIKLEENCTCLFAGLPALTDVSALSRLDTSGMTKMTEMFAGDSSLTDLSSIAGWNVSKVEGMYLAFRECTSLETIAPLANWATTSLTDVSGMFYKCEWLRNISALSNWNTDNLNEMYNMLSGCKYLWDISPIANWKTGKVTNMTGVFGGCSNLSDFSPVANWNLSSNTLLQATFSGTAITTTKDLANWGTSDVENISMCFASCEKLSDLSGLANWKCKPEIMQYVFMSCPSLKTLEGLNNWDVSQCEYFNCMFSNCYSLEDTTAISNWVPTVATEMNYMFSNASAIKTVDLNFFTSSANKEGVFSGIDTSSVRHFKLTDLKANTEAIMEDNNICDLENMDGLSLHYQLKDSDKTYSSWAELLADWDTVSGQWIDVIVTHSVKFYKENNFTQDPIKTIVGTEDEPIGEFNVTQPTKEGYKFVGWYYYKVYTETAFDKTTVITGDTNVFAKWEQNSTPTPQPETVTYKVQFNSNGGSSVPTQTVESGKTATRPSNPTKTGYTFVNWYSDSSLTTVYNFGTSVTANKTLYAKWEKDASPAPSEDVTLYRLYNPYSGEHLFTKDSNEYNNLAKIGWKQENVAWTSPSSSKTPVYRLYNKYSGDHHYTTDKKEYEYLGSIGWNKEGEAWYSDDSKGKPVYRLYNPYVTIGTHHYTTSKSEYDYLETVGWRQEGEGWYGLK